MTFDQGQYSTSLFRTLGDNATLVAELEERYDVMPQPIARERHYDPDSLLQVTSSSNFIAQNPLITVSSLHYGIGVNDVSHDPFHFYANDWDGAGRERAMQKRRKEAPVELGDRDIATLILSIQNETGALFRYDPSITRFIQFSYNYPITTTRHKELIDAAYILANYHPDMHDAQRPTLKAIIEQQGNVGQLLGGLYNLAYALTALDKSVPGEEVYYNQFSGYENAINLGSEAREKAIREIIKVVGPQIIEAKTMSRTNALCAFVLLPALKSPDNAWVMVSQKLKRFAISFNGTIAIKSPDELPVDMLAEQKEQVKNVNIAFDVARGLVDDQPILVENRGGGGVSGQKPAPRPQSDEGAAIVLNVSRENSVLDLIEAYLYCSPRECERYFMSGGGDTTFYRAFRQKLIFAITAHHIDKKFTHQEALVPHNDYFGGDTRKLVHLMSIPDRGFNETYGQYHEQVEDVATELLNTDPHLYDAELMFNDENAYRQHINDIFYAAHREEVFGDADVIEDDRSDYHKMYYAKDSPENIFLSQNHDAVQYFHVNYDHLYRNNHADQARAYMHDSHEKYLQDQYELLQVNVSKREKEVLNGLVAAYGRTIEMSDDQFYNTIGFQHLISRAANYLYGNSEDAAVALFRKATSRSTLAFYAPFDEFKNANLDDLYDGVIELNSFSHDPQVLNTNLNNLSRAYNKDTMLKIENLYNIRLGGIRTLAEMDEEKEELDTQAIVGDRKAIFIRSLEGVIGEDFTLERYLQPSYEAGQTAKAIIEPFIATVPSKYTLESLSDFVAVKGTSEHRARFAELLTDPVYRDGMGAYLKKVEAQRKLGIYESVIQQ